MNAMFTLNITYRNEKLIGEAIVLSGFQWFDLNGGKEEKNEGLHIHRMHVIV